MISRTFLAAALLLSPAFAAPPLTTIQDTLYKADGTRFNGTLTITWSSFQAADASAILTQGTTVKVVGGNLRVQLVPNATSAPQSYYTVKYVSDGKVQFQELWSVPASAQPLRVRDVRMSAPNLTASADTTGGSSGPIQESDVVGLIGDLTARPTKGPGYSAGQVAVVNALGNLETVTGNPEDCVRVDGSSGPCGAGTVAFVDGEPLAGLVDGANTAFTIAAAAYPPTSLMIFRNGLLQKAVQDYTVGGQHIQFVADNTPQPGDTLLASYRIGGSDNNSTQQPYPAQQVLCAGTGSPTGSQTLVSLGTCSIPAGLLAAGDRVEIRFDMEHQGSVGGFSVDVRWGGTAIVARDGTGAETILTGRVDSSLAPTGAQLSYQTWGAVMPMAVGIAGSTDNFLSGLSVDFRGKVAAAGDSLTLRNYSVVRIP